MESVAGSEGLKEKLGSGGGFDRWLPGNDSVYSVGDESAANEAGRRPDILEKEAGVEEGG